MADGANSSLAQARALVQNLRDLGAVGMPPDLVGKTLARLGVGDMYWVLDSPLGGLYVACNELGISAVSRAADAAAFERYLRARVQRPVYPAKEPPALLTGEIARHLRGERARSLRFDLRGLSEFERAVLLKALEIPRGEVRPYAWIAREIGRPRAVRAVGSALAANPVPLLIPCHRVLRSDGHLGQYGMGGPAAKHTLLEAEGAEPERLEALARAGVRYSGSDSTRVFCFPTCRHARATTEPHRVTFGSAGDAMRAGYRPCKVCRPALAS
jgi:O-6-methylguanine DNA methyltransferase